MKWETIFDKHTDFISEYQDILIWGFHFEKLLETYETGDYSVPVRKALLLALRSISESKYKRIQGARFTIWMGDYGPQNEFFCVGVPSKLSYTVTDILSSYLTGLEGFDFLECGSIPYVPLIPIYRYEEGKVIEYTSDETLAGKKKKIDDEEEYGSGLKIIYRIDECAEALDMKEKYQG